MAKKGSSTTGFGPSEERELRATTVPPIGVFDRIFGTDEAKRRLAWLDPENAAALDAAVAALQGR